MLIKSDQDQWSELNMTQYMYENYSKIITERTELLLNGLSVPPCPLWIPHIQVMSYRLRAPNTRTARHPRQFTLWTVKCPPPPHYAISMCNNLIFICYHLHPSTSLHLLLFFSIPSSIAQLYIQSFMFHMIFFLFFVYLYLHVYFFNSHLIFIVCVSLLSVNCDTKTNSLYAQAYLAIKALSDSEMMCII